MSAFDLDAFLLLGVQGLIAGHSKSTDFPMLQYSATAITITNTSTNS